MSAWILLMWIAAALLLQLAVFAGIGFVRQWRAYLLLRRLAGAHGLVVDGLAVDGVAGADAAPPAPAAWAGYRNFRVVRKVQEDASGQICSFYLAPQDKAPLPAFLPGQFLTLALDIPGQGGTTAAVVRCYSLSDAPQPEHYRITVKRAAAPANSALAPGLASNYLNEHVAVGDVLRVRAPGGRFHLDRSKAPVVLIGGGIGLTPLLSMLNGCLVQQPGRELWLIYAVNHRDELVMSAHLKAMALEHPNFHLHLCLFEPPAAPAEGTGDQASALVHYHQGRADLALLRQLLPLKPYHFYLCGPPAMLQSLVSALEEWGVPPERIHFEAFGPASVQRAQAAAAPNPGPQVASDVGPPVMVRFSKADKQFVWEPAMGSLLDFAQASGVRVDSGCRAGSCGSCQTTIRSGEVRYLQTPDFDPEPGTCLLCVCVPKTDVTLEA